MTEETLKKRLYEVIFGTETPAGKRFDIVLLYLIILSVLVLFLESIEVVYTRYYLTIRGIEWAFTLLFTIEYAVRIYCSPKPYKYMTSFYGVVDLISVLPSYIGLLIPGANYLLVVRLVRVLRVFRVLKLVRYLSEANTLIRSMLLARRKIAVFFMSVLVLATVLGSLMYVIEGPSNGFSSIPRSIYWTIVTITTVGYGDITPQTPLGQIIAAFAMLLGYSIIAIPTGILTAELSHEIHRERLAHKCQSCERQGHDNDAKCCKYCGEVLYNL